MLTKLLIAFIAFMPFLVLILAILFARKWLIRYLFRTMMEILLTDEYGENLAETIPALKRLGTISMLENQLRAEDGKLLHRSLGTARQWPNFDSITFIPAQTSPFPIDKEVVVDMSQTIGKSAQKPLHIDIPIMIGGMAYGLAVSKKAKMALAQASAKAKTAINSGEGGILPEAKEEAHKFILQFSKTSWGKENQDLSGADMIEIKLGQGASAGMGGHTIAAKIPADAKTAMGLEEDEDAIIHELFFENQTLSDLKELVSELRKTSGGVPIGMKIAAGGNLEKDLDHLIKIDVDFIAIEGGQGGTHDAPPILQDDFGIPTLHAVVRAEKHLRKRKVKNDISLIVSGGLNTPGDFLKAIALGADAIYIGSAMLYAINHTQI